MTKPPAFQFYAKDFYSGTAIMSSAAVGAYARSLAWSWDNGPLPADHSVWAKQVYMTPAEFKRIWHELKPKFTKSEAGYINPRLEVERAKQDAYREKQAAKGRHSAQQRFNRGSTVVTTTVQPEHQPDGEPETQPKGQPEGNSSSSSLSSPTEDQKRRDPDGPQALADAWNSGVRRPIPRCRELTEKRRRAAKARLAERPLTEWQEVIARIDASRFCRGEMGGTWVASFDWMLAPGNAVKVLEGNYDDRGNSAPTPIRKSQAELDRIARALGPWSWRTQCIRQHRDECDGDEAAHEARIARETAVAS